MYNKLKKGEHIPSVGAKLQILQNGEIQIDKIGPYLPIAIANCMIGVPIANRHANC